MHGLRLERYISTYYRTYWNMEKRWRFPLTHIVLDTVGLIYQSNVETSADPSTKINLRQSSHVIYETFVCRQSHRTKDCTLINMVAENNRHLNSTPLKIWSFYNTALLQWSLLQFLTHVGETHRYTKRLNYLGFCCD